MAPQTLLRPDDVSFSFCGTTLSGGLVAPEGAVGLAILVDLADLGRRGASVQAIGRALYRAGLATLTVDLLPSRGADDPDPIRRAVDRLIAVIDRVRAGPEVGSLPVGLIGIGSGAAVAMWTASLLRPEIGAVVSLDGRTEGSERWLNLVLAPTLLVVGRKDAGVLEANREALGRMLCDASIEVVDEGSEEREADVAADWLLVHLSNASVSPSWLSDRARALSRTGRAGGVPSFA